MVIFGNFSYFWPLRKLWPKKRRLMACEARRLASRLVADRKKERGGAYHKITSSEASFRCTSMGTSSVGVKCGRSSSYGGGFALERRGALNFRAGQRGGVNYRARRECGEKMRSREAPRYFTGSAHYLPVANPVPFGHRLRPTAATGSWPRALKRTGRGRFGPSLKLQRTLRRCSGQVAT